MTRPGVVVVSNDVVPGMSMPVAAPGLRAWGIAKGLEAHGWAPTLAVAAGPVRNQWQGAVPPPTPPGAVVVEEDALGSFLEARAPAIAVLTNTNQVRRIHNISGVRLIIDLFSPQVLERVSGSGVNADSLARLIERKMAGLRAADGFIVNGRKKLPYFVGWMTRAGIDVRNVPIEVVEMSLPSTEHLQPPSKPLKILVAGYLQRWSKPGEWLAPIRRHLEAGSVELHLVTPVHWGQREASDRVSAYDSIVGLPGVVRHQAMRFDRFRSLLAATDVVLDLFPWTLEREYAMVTRSVVALASGVPVIHPPFTEVSPIIESESAGWLVDPSDGDAISSVLDSLVTDPAGIVARSAGAARLATERFEPARAVAPLAAMVSDLSAVGAT